MKEAVAGQYIFQFGFRTTITSGCLTVLILLTKVLKELSFENKLAMLSDKIVRLLLSQYFFSLIKSLSSVSV